jgi:hypothetical protein
LEKQLIQISYSDIYLYSTIRQLASFIGNSTELTVDKPHRVSGFEKDFDIKETTSTVDPVEFRLNGKIIDNIEPFNEFRYKSCFYSSLFPVLNHFNIELFSIMLNDMII